MPQDKIFKCFTTGCEDGCEEAPGWCDECLALGDSEKAELNAAKRFKRTTEASKE